MRRCELLLDESDGLAWVEVLRAGLGAVLKGGGMLR